MNLSVLNLDTRFTSEDLRQLFTVYGEVANAEVAIDSFTDQSRGFGFVEMPQEEEARAALAALHQSEVNGRKISVKEAEPQTTHKGSYKVGNGAVNVYRFKKN
ncbi:MAG TPA: RNA-binding protein [Chitinophagaceae bacterium]